MLSLRRRAGEERDPSVGTPWVERATPFRRFLRTEAGSAVVLLAATVASLVWVNVAAASYDGAWDTELSVHLGSTGVAMDLRAWINSGLMTFFFFVIGLEARREIDVGELRERVRVALPLIAGLSGMVAAVSLYLAINAGHSSAHGWGVAMSTDTAFALGLLALVGRRAPDRLRSFILTAVVLDDVIALLVIATVYTDHVSVGPLLVAVGLFSIIVAGISLRIRGGLPYFVVAAACWVAVLKSGVDPIVVGLASGLVVYATPAARPQLERATDLFRGFREQPTAELERTARAGLRAAVPPNDRLQMLYHPWTSYVIVPLFALANAGVPVHAGRLSDALHSRITVGIVVGYLVGKPVGVVGSSWLVSRLGRGRSTPPVGWAAVVGAGTLTGIGFTVSLLIAALAFDGTDLEEAKLGILAGALGAALLTALLFAVTARLPKLQRLRLLYGRSEVIIDLADPVDPERDHIRGPEDAAVTLVEYGDFECPYCGQAEPSVRELLADFGDLRYVWRHLPLADVHPRAQRAAEAAEAAAAQGAFWPMHDLLLAQQDALAPKDLTRHAEQLGLDAERFAEDLREGVGAARVAADVESADLSDVAGTPTFFINGVRHRGPFDLNALTTAVRAARARAYLATAK